MNLPEASAANRTTSARALRSLGLGLITGAADDDPSAMGTYAAAGAAFGPALLWTAPVAFPMMFAVVSLCSKVGRVTGQGLFLVIKEHYAKSVLWPLLVTAVVGNVIEAGADIGGMAAALNLLLPLRIEVLTIAIAAAVLALQLFGSYELIRSIFRWLALALLAYVGAALLAHPALLPTLKGTFLPKVYLRRDFMAMVVAVLGTTLSAYLYLWQSNQDVLEDRAAGRAPLRLVPGDARTELRRSAYDIAFGMFFSSAVMYFIILAASSTLFPASHAGITSAADAARALAPIAGRTASVLFTVGVVGVGFIAVPVMTIGAAFDLAQSFGWPHGLDRRPREVKKFYATIVTCTLIALGLNFFGLNPMKALVIAGIVQGISTPLLMIVVMRVTNNPRIMGSCTNTAKMNVLGWITVVVMVAALAGLLFSMVYPLPTEPSTASTARDALDAVARPSAQS
jgi:NRAMP (natural resistance-associated macrophage protein)-like metal ion transporter